MKPWRAGLAGMLLGAGLTALAGWKLELLPLPSLISPGGKPYLATPTRRMRDQPLRDLYAHVLVPDLSEKDLRRIADDYDRPDLAPPVRLSERRSWFDRIRGRDWSSGELETPVEPLGEAPQERPTVLGEWKTGILPCGGKALGLLELDGRPSLTVKPRRWCGYVDGELEAGPAELDGQATAGLQGAFKKLPGEWRVGAGIGIRGDWRVVVGSRFVFAP